MPNGTSFDWVSKGAVTPVKNQGNCGSCWAFATVASLEGLNFLEGNTLTSFSEQYVVDCSTENYGCDGGWPYLAYDLTEKSGIPTEEAYPYKGVDGTCDMTTERPFKNSGHVVTRKYNPSDLQDALEKNPVAVCLSAGNDAFSSYKGGIIDSECGVLVDHCITLTGYGTDESGVEYWKLKNSWGEDWGEEGYVRIERTSSGVGMCGMYQDNAYPLA